MMFTDRNERFAPGKLWSLWDYLMLQLDGPRFLNAIHEVSAFRQMLMFHRQKNSGQAIWIDQKGKDDLTRALSFLLETVCSLGMVAPERQISWMLNHITNATVADMPNLKCATILEWEDVSGLEQTCDRIIVLCEASFEGHVFLALEQRNGLFWDNATPVLQQVENKFPDAIPELIEASKCIAVERATASVFHSMRAVEHGISYLSGRLSVIPRNPNWENVLNEITAKINVLGPSFGANWQDEKQVFSAAVAHARLFQRAWRNHVMHGSSTYSDADSRAIFEAVKSFLTELAA